MECLRSLSPRDDLVSNYPKLTILYDRMLNCDAAARAEAVQCGETLSRQSLGCSQASVNAATDSVHRICLPKMRPKLRATACTACSIVGMAAECSSISSSRLVTAQSVIPQGTISRKSRRSAVTFQANPWDVMPCEMWTPIAAIFFSGMLPPGSVHTPVLPAMRWVNTPYSAQVRINTSSNQRTYSTAPKCGPFLPGNVPRKSRMG